MIKVTELVKIYHKGKANEHIILDHVNLEIGRGEMVAVMGKSGAGKSTLLQILAGITDYDEGEYFCGKQLIKNRSDREMAKFRNKRIGIVLQDFSLIEEFRVLENVTLPLEFSGKYSKKKTDKLGRSFLKYVGLEEQADQKAGTLSGGEKQRTAIARALVNHPDILLADEPTGALDSEKSARVMELLKKAHKDGKTIVLVTHDIDIARQADRMIQVKDGRIVC
ncbi:MAG: ABC transporter ATP-binding protein [Eubacteriales bacterium]|nr:ABC transporter ATP-binding protein [Eubacteriales bacterium]